MKQLNVFYEQRKVGELRRDDELLFTFRYDTSWASAPDAFPLSIALPLSNNEYGNKKTLSFFENLLPEGDVRQAIARAHSIESDFDFLRMFGEDCAGAVIVTEAVSSPFKASTQDKRPLDMERVFEAIDQKQSVADVISETEPGYLSLAGAQDKFAAIVEGGNFYLPEHGSPTTHIVKVPITRKGVSESVFNEYYCMELARRVGMAVPSCSIMGGGHPLFVIERYDRIKDKQGNIRRLHQQDFCQAQGRTSEEKYQARGGPTLADNYALIKEHVTIRKRVGALTRFLDWVCFNLLIGNNDSHSKNISFLLVEGKIELAPFYDLISTAVYPKLSSEFSFQLGGRSKHHEIGKNQFMRLDQELGLKSGTSLQRLAQMHDLIMQQRLALAEEMEDTFTSSPVVAKIQAVILDRSKGLRMQGAL